MPQPVTLGSVRPRSACRLDEALDTKLEGGVVPSEAGGRIMGKDDFSSAAELGGWLSLHGVSTAQWGSGAAKSLASLLQEINSGETRLRPSIPAVRMVRVVSVMVRRPGSSEVLVEQHQQLADGRVRIRNQLLAEKLIKDEAPRAAVHRALREELGERLGDAAGIVVSDDVVWPVGVETEVSKSYPTLLSEYSLYWFAADVPGLPETDFHTTELVSCADGSSVPKQRHFWAWRGLDMVAALLEERRRAARLAADRRRKTTVAVENNVSSTTPPAIGTHSDGCTGAGAAGGAPEAKETGAARPIIFDLAFDADNGRALTHAALADGLYRWRFNETDRDAIMKMANAEPAAEDTTSVLTPADLTKVHAAILERRMDIEDRDWLDEEEISLISRLFPPELYSRVRARRLHGGFSGSKVLAIHPFDTAGAFAMPAVVKLDDISPLMEERANADEMARRVGPSACRCVDWCLGKERGALLFELVGGCWCLPGMVEFSHVSGGIEVWRALFLNTVAAGAGQPARRLLRSPRSVLEDVFGETLCRAVLGSVETAQRDPFETFKVRSAADRCARKCPIEGAGSVAARSIALAESGGLTECRISYVHGDLNGSNILIDTAGMAWIIDFAKSGRGHVLADVTKLEAFILFECRGPPGRPMRMLVDALTSGLSLLLPDNLPASVRADVDGGESDQEWLELAWSCLVCLRVHAARYLGRSVDPRQYYVSLLALALKSSTYMDEWMDRGLALYASERICGTIEALQSGSPKFCEGNVELTETTVDGEEMERQLQRYLISERATQAYIVDPITRAALNIEDHIVPLRVMSADDVEAVFRAKTIDRHAEAQLVATRRNRVRGAESTIRDAGDDGSMGDFLEIAIGSGNPANPGRVMLLGAAASGKSCMIKRALVVAARLRAEGRGRVPIMIPVIDLARFLSGSPALTAADDLAGSYLRHRFGAGTARYMMLQHHLKSDGVLLLLDGLDEGGDQREIIVAYIERLCSETRISLVISSRIAGFEAKEGFANMRYLQICSLNPQLQMDIIEKRLGSTEVEAVVSGVKDDIRTNQAYSEMSENPLMLSMLISILAQTRRDSKNGRALTSQLTQAQLYDIAVSAMLHHTARGKHVHIVSMDTGNQVAKDLELLKLDETKQLLEVLAFDVHMARTRDIRSVDLIAAMAKCIEESQSDPDAEERYQDVCNALSRGIRSGLVALFVLLAEHSGDTMTSWSQVFSFAHLTFQEFFAAKRIVSVLLRSQADGGEAALESKASELLWGDSANPIMHRPWMKKVVSFCGTMLCKTAAISGVVKALMELDDITAANACVLNQWASEGTMPAEVAERVTLGPSPEIQRMALTEVRVFGMEVSSVTAAMVREVVSLDPGNRLGWLLQLSTLRALSGLQCRNEEAMLFIIDQLREAPLSAPRPSELRTVGIRTLMNLDVTTDPVACQHIASVVLPLLKEVDTQDDACRLCEMFRLPNWEVISVLKGLDTTAAARALCVCVGSDAVVDRIMKEGDASAGAQILARAIKQGSTRVDYLCPALAALCGTVLQRDKSEDQRMAILVALLESLGTPPAVAACILDLCDMEGAAAAGRLFGDLPAPWNGLATIPESIGAAPGHPGDAAKADAVVHACAASIKHRLSEVPSQQLKPQPPPSRGAERLEMPNGGRRTPGNIVDITNPTSHDEEIQAETTPNASLAGGDSVGDEAGEAAVGSLRSQTGAEGAEFAPAKSEQSPQTTGGDPGSLEQIEARSSAEDRVRAQIEARSEMGPPDLSAYSEYAESVLRGEADWKTCTALLGHANDYAAALLRELFAVQLPECDVTGDHGVVSWLGSEPSADDGDSPGVISRLDIAVHHTITAWRNRWNNDAEWTPDPELRALIAARASAGSPPHIMIAKELRMGRDEIQFANVADGSVAVPGVAGSMLVDPSRCVREMNQTEIESICELILGYLESHYPGSRSVVFGGVLRDFLGEIPQYRNIDFKCWHRQEPVDLPRSIGDQARITRLQRTETNEGYPVIDPCQVTSYAVELTNPTGDPGPVIVNVVWSPEDPEVFEQVGRHLQGTLDFDVDAMEMERHGRFNLNYLRDSATLTARVKMGPNSRDEAVMACDIQVNPERTFKAMGHAGCANPASFTVDDVVRIVTRCYSLQQRGWRFEFGPCPHASGKDDIFGCRYALLKPLHGKSGMINGFPDDSLYMAQALVTLMLTHPSRLAVDAREKLLGLIARCARHSPSDIASKPLLWRCKEKFRDPASIVQLEDKLRGCSTAQEAMEVVQNEVGLPYEPMGMMIFGDLTQSHFTEHDWARREDDE